MFTDFKNSLKRILFGAVTATLAACMTIGSSIPALAAEPQKGTLTIRPKYGDEILTASGYDGTFKVYHIADETGTGAFTKDAELQDMDVTITSDILSDDESYKELTKAVASYVSGHSDAVNPVHTGIKVDETVTINYGLYLVMADRIADGYLEFEPFLALIPDFSEGAAVSNVIAYPKVSPEPDEPENPDTPDTPDRPHRSGGSNPPATPNVEEIGSIEESGTEGVDSPASIEEAGAFTGDTSQMLLYGGIAIAAAAALALWVVKRRKAR